ncbi:MAG: cyclic nucleotide-binding domain-containing protein [Myxococcales bacterium]|nr:cyclic nucleotide-binding domain-containing protein [Myxococcales bacterium]
MNDEKLIEGLTAFVDLTQRERETLLAIFQRRDYDTGEVLCREGDRPFTFFILCRGTVEVLKSVRDGVNEKLGELTRGSMIGQVSLIDGKPRSATVQAMTAVTTLECSRDDFDRLFNAGSPFAFKVLDQIVIHLSRRLRDANRQLYSLYSRPTETILKLHAACVDIQRILDDSHTSSDDIEIRPIFGAVDEAGGAT